MTIITNFLIGGAVNVAQNLPIVGPLVITPIKELGSAVYSIGKLALAVIGIGVAVSIGVYFVAKTGIYIVSSATSCVYHLFAKTSKEANLKKA